MVCRSVDSWLAGGFALGAEDLKSLAPEDGAGLAGFAAVSGVAGVAGLPGSFILLLENILSSSYVNHWVNGASAYADFIVQVWSG